MNISKIKVGNTTYDIKDSSMEGVGQTVNSIDSKIDVISSKIDLIQVSTSGGGDGIPEDYYITSYTIDLTNLHTLYGAIYKETPSIIADRCITVGGEPVYVDVIRRIIEETKLYARDSSKEGFVVRELDRTDKTKFKDGTSSTHPSNNMIWEYYQKFPRFWYKIKEIRSNVYKVMFTMEETIADETWKEWGGNTFIGIYYGSGTDDNIAKPYRNAKTNGTASDTLIVRYSYKPHYSLYVDLKNSSITFDTVQVLMLLYYGYFGGNDDLYYGNDIYVNSAYTGFYDTYGMSFAHYGGGGYMNLFGLEFCNENSSSTYINGLTVSGNSSGPYVGTSSSSTYYPFFNVEGDSRNFFYTPTLYNGNIMDVDRALAARYISQLHLDSGYLLPKTLIVGETTGSWPIFGPSSLFGKVDSFPSTRGTNMPTAFRVDVRQGVLHYLVNTSNDFSSRVRNQYTGDYTEVDSF